MLFNKLCEMILISKIKNDSMCHWCVKVSWSDWSEQLVLMPFRQHWHGMWPWSTSAASIVPKRSGACVVPPPDHWASACGCEEQYKFETCIDIFLVLCHEKVSNDMRSFWPNRPFEKMNPVKLLPILLWLSQVPLPGQDQANDFVNCLN